MNDPFDDIFTGKEPNLIDNNINKFIEKLPKKQIEPFQYNKPSISDSFQSFYSNYIEANLILLFLLFFIILYLIYRYYARDIIKNENFGNNIGTFNPYYPVSLQKSYTNYLPDSYPVKVNGKYMNRKQYFESLQPSTDSYSQTEYDDYQTKNNNYKYNKNNKQIYKNKYNKNNINNINNINKTKTTHKKFNDKIIYYNTNHDNNFDDYTGTYNTYEYSENPSDPNVLGFIADENSTTREALNYTSHKNKLNLDLLADIIFN